MGSDRRSDDASPKARPRGSLPAEGSPSPSAITAAGSGGAGGAGSDARQGLRVEHLLRMEYEVVPPEEIETMRAAIEHGPRILKAEWSPRHQAPVFAGGENATAFADWGWETPPVAESLQRIERKLDLILERLGVDAPGLKPKPLYNVNLSGRGLRFRDHRRECQDGDMVYLCLELPMNPTVEIMALAEATCVVEDAGTRHLSAGRDVVLEFRVIQDEARELIERYCRLQHEATRRKRFR